MRSPHATAERASEQCHHRDAPLPRGHPAHCPFPARPSRSPTSDEDSHISFQRCYGNDRQEQKSIPPDPIIVDLVTEDMNERIPEIFPNLLREDAFPTVRKGGYDKRQVDDFVVRNHNQLRDLQERLARAHDELEQLRRELAEAKAKAAVKPEHEQISERLANILRIAEEEAADKRAQVDKEVKEIRAKAEEEAKAKIKSAQEQAERIVNGARDEAKELLTSTKQEAERLREEAAKEAERKLNEAEARANKIHDVADRRLKRLVATHGEAVRRLNDMRDTLAELLKAEAKAGALDAGLKRSDFEGSTDKESASAASSKQSSPQAAEPEGAANAQRPASPDNEPTARLNPADKEPTARLNPASSGAAADGKAENQVKSAPAAQGARPIPGRPQGFRYAGPAPTDAGSSPTPPPPSTELTGVYQASVPADSASSADSGSSAGSSNAGSSAGSSDSGSSGGSDSSGGGF